MIVNNFIEYFQKTIYIIFLYFHKLYMNISCSLANIHYNNI